jgi:hypothetical protein
MGGTLLGVITKKCGEWRVESEVGTETGMGDGGRHGGDIAGSNYKKVGRVESGE